MSIKLETYKNFQDGTYSVHLGSSAVLWRRHLNYLKVLCLWSGAHPKSLVESSWKWMRKGVFLTLWNILFYMSSYGVVEDYGEIWGKKSVQKKLGFIFLWSQDDRISKRRFFVVVVVFVWFVCLFFLNSWQIMVVRSGYICLEIFAWKYLLGNLNLGKKFPKWNILVQ